MQTDASVSENPIPDESGRATESHLWLGLPPWNQLEHEQNALVRAHADNDVSRMLRGVVSNMLLLTKLSREAGFAPYMGNAHYIYACYLKNKINSSRPPSDCDLSSVWSLQVDLDKDMPKVCSLAMKPSF